MNLMTIPPGSTADLSHSYWLQGHGLPIIDGVAAYRKSAKRMAAIGRIGLSAVRMAQATWLQMLIDKHHNEPQAEE